MACIDNKNTSASMSEALPITVVLNVGSGHAEASTCERQIREGLEAGGREYRIVVAGSAAQVERQTRLAIAAARARSRSSWPPGVMEPST